MRSVLRHGNLCVFLKQSHIWAAAFELNLLKHLYASLELVKCGMTIPMAYVTISSPYSYEDGFISMLLQHDRLIVVERYSGGLTGWKILSSGSERRGAVEAIRDFIPQPPGCRQVTSLAPVAAWRLLPSSKKGVAPRA